MNRLLLGLFVLIALSSPHLAKANEFIVKPVLYRVQPGTSIPFHIISAAVLMNGQEMEPLDKTTAEALAGEQRFPIKLRKNNFLKSLGGAVRMDHPGGLLIAAQRGPVLWSRTPKGWYNQGRRGLSDVIESGSYEKFAKALIVCGGLSDGYDRPVGHLLELIPLSDPSKIKPGETLLFETRLEGRPVAAELYAVFDGFSQEPGAWSFYRASTTPEPVGVVVDRPGLWLVRTEHVMPGNEDFDRRVLRATYAFHVIRDPQP